MAFPWQGTSNSLPAYESSGSVGYGFSNTFSTTKENTYRLTIPSLDVGSTSKSVFTVQKMKSKTSQGRETPYKKMLTAQASQRERLMAKVETWFCKICNKNFGSKGGLNRHLTTVHKQPRATPVKEPKAVVPYRASSGDINITCNLCWKKFSSRGSLSRHLTTVHNPGGNSVIKKKIVQKNRTNVTINMYKPQFNLQY